MSKIYRATAAGGLITVGNTDIPDATHQTGGQGNSSGVFLIDGDTNVYIPVGSAGDLLAILDAIELLASILIKVPPTSPIPPPTGYPTNLILNGTLIDPSKGLDVNKLISSLQKMRENLK